ncbi:MAG: 50S ribosomal protein L11 methyltransferase [Sphingomonadaceae bacterium]
MSQSWKITIAGSQDAVEGALVAHEEALEWDPEIVLSGTCAPPGSDGDWLLEAFLPRRPRKGDKAAITALFAGETPDMTVEKLPDLDWVVESQKGLEPIRAGRFLVHTPDHDPPVEAGVHRFVIPAGQAFGTGHHQTTAGCLAMLSRMKRSGVLVRNCADIGTGTGVLAFAAMKLWPRAIVTASDIDPVSAAVTIENAELNSIPVGSRGGEMTVTIADGMTHPLIAARGPYDLVIANILAGPLIELAPAFSRALVPGGSLLLAGLMNSQERAVRAACRQAGFRIAARIVEGDWPVLWLRKRPAITLRERRAVPAEKW